VIVAGGDLTTEVLDPETGKWRRGPDLPEELHGATLVEDALGGVILVGGWHGDVFSDNLWRLPHAGSSWIKLPQRLNPLK